MFETNDNFTMGAATTLEQPFQPWLLGRLHLRHVEQTMIFVNHRRSVAQDSLVDVAPSMVRWCVAEMDSVEQQTSRPSKTHRAIEMTVLTKVRVGMAPVILLRFQQHHLFQ